MGIPFRSLRDRAGGRPGDSRRGILPRHTSYLHPIRHALRCSHPPRYDPNPPPPTANRDPHVRVFLYILVIIGACLLTGALSLRFMCSRDQARIADAMESLVPRRDDSTIDHADWKDLPDPARRYLSHALQDGGTRSSVVDLDVRGEIHVQSDTEFAAYTATHRIAPSQGYVWQAEVSPDGRALVGAESLIDGKGRASFWWHFFVPVRREGDDVDRGARERLAFDRIYIPASLLPADDVTWDAIDEDRASVTIGAGASAVTLVLQVDESGALKSVSTRRWGDVTDDRAYTTIPFGCVVLEEATFEGITIPSRLSFRWWFGEDREQEFVRPTVVAAHFR